MFTTYIVAWCATPELCASVLDETPVPELAIVGTVAGGLPTKANSVILVGLILVPFVLVRRIQGPALLMVTIVANCVHSMVLLV